MPASQQQATQPQTQQQPSQSSGDVPDYGGIYGQAQAAADEAYQKAQASIQAKRSGIMNQYGYAPDGSVDGNNPLGLYQQGRRQDALELSAAEDDAMDRGLGTSGLGAQVANAPRYGEAVRDAGIAGQYLDAMHGTDVDLENAYADRTNALLAARENQIQTAIQNGWFDSPATPGSDSAVPNPPSQRAQQTASRLARTMPTPTTRVTARSTERPAPKRDTRPKTVVYRGRH